MATYRACYYTSPDGQSETVLTGPEHAALSDDDLLAEAMAEGERAGLFSDTDPDMLTRSRFRAGLCIGEWTE